MKNNKGFAPILLIIIVLLMVVVFFWVFRSSSQKDEMGPEKMDGDSMMMEDKPLEEGADLEKEFNSLELSDPENDFSQVDSDINSL